MLVFVAFLFKFYHPCVFPQLVFEGRQSRRGNAYMYLQTARPILDTAVSGRENNDIKGQTELTLTVFPPWSWLELLP